MRWTIGVRRTEQRMSDAYDDSIAIAADGWRNRRIEEERKRIRKGIGGKGGIEGLRTREGKEEEDYGRKRKGGEEKWEEE